MPDLRRDQAEWTRFLARELVGTFLAPLRQLREVRDQFRLERTQVVNWADVKSATPHFARVRLAGVDYGKNTSLDGRLFVRITPGAALGTWDVRLFQAPGGAAPDEVAHALGVAAGATALVSANGSSLTGEVTLGPAIVAETDDRHQLLVFVDWRARLRRVFTGDEGIEDDEASRTVLAETYGQVTVALDQGIQALKTAVERWALTDGEETPIARGNAFLEARESTLTSDSAFEDASGNVARRRTGFFETLTRAMVEETKGGEQDVRRIVVKAGPAVFASGNSGLGVVLPHTPGELCPESRWTFRCVRGVDTGDLGKEEFEGFVAFTRAGDDRVVRFSGLRVKKSWAGPLMFGPIFLDRIRTKTGDPQDQSLAPASAATETGENGENTEKGVLYWRVLPAGPNFDFEFYRASGFTPSDLVAKAPNVVAGAPFVAVEQGGFGISVHWRAGPNPQLFATGSLALNPFRVENKSQQPDQFEVVVTHDPGAGLIQRLLAEELAATLNSDVAGAETIPDDVVRAGTFVPFVEEDN